MILVYTCGSCNCLDGITVVTPSSHTSNVVGKCVLIRIIILSREQVFKRKTAPLEANNIVSKKITDRQTGMNGQSPRNIL